MKVESKEEKKRKGFVVVHASLVEKNTRLLAIGYDKEREINAQTLIFVGKKRLGNA